MFKSLNTAATGMQAQATNLEVISNNLANVQTSGFKRSRAEFEDLLYQNVKEPGAQSGLNAVSPTGIQTGLGVKTSAIQKDFEVGSAKMTGNDLDIMIEGQGFFPIQIENGQIGYTRDGSFKKDPTGRIVDRNGRALIPEITIPPGTTNVGIAENGEVSVMTQAGAAPQVIGQIQTVSFINPAGLKAMGKNTFVPTEASGVPNQGIPGTNELGQLSQGQLEGSNVNIVEEMTNMISAQRAYEMNSKAIQASDAMLQSLNNLR